MTPQNAIVPENPVSRSLPHSQSSSPGRLFACLAAAAMLAAGLAGGAPANPKESTMPTDDVNFASSKPAAAVDVPAGQVQIFVDDVMLAAKSGVVRKAQACAKLAKPVLAAEKPWEATATDKRVYIFGTVLAEQPGSASQPVATGPATAATATAPLLRMWYMHSSGRILTATSTDGVNWQRPSLGLVEFDGSTDNNILPIHMESPSVIDDPHEKDPAKRYKMLGCDKGAAKGYCVAYSADGLGWTRYPRNPIFPGGDTCTLAQDARSGEYLAFFKRTHELRGKNRRLVYLSVSKDMQEWSEPKLVMAPDEIDDAAIQAAGGQYSQFYNMSVFARGGQYLGLVTHFRYMTLRPRAPQVSPHDGPIDVQLVHSRDGRTWSRCEDRSPVIPLGPSAFDAGCILGVANMPVIVGDEMWVYYTAITTTHGGTMPEKQVSIGRASWPLDRFVGLTAGGDGVVQTVPLNLAAGGLVVNANAAGGTLAVEALDEHGQVLSGYSRTDCTAISTDSVRHRIAWKDHAALPTGKPVSLRFYLTKASLFGYSVTR